MQTNQTISLEKMQMLPIVGKQPESEKEEKFLREVCLFEFHNLEEPGIIQKFQYGNTKHHHTFLFMHNGKYKVPRFVARHLESCATPIWEWRPDGTGRLEKKYIGQKSRFQMRQIFEQ